uniref:TEP1-F n=1 Tax=Chthamalus fissus TaxID=116177 RepID=V9LXN1_CHTFI|nr:MULTIFUNCin [Chthamalus fissus]
MIPRHLAPVLLLAALAAGQKVPESGYLMTAPKVLQAGTSERACITMYKLPGPGRQIKLTFSQRDRPFSLAQTLDESDFQLFTSQTAIPDTVDENGEYCFDIDVPATVTVRYAQVNLELTSTNGLKMTESSPISINPEALVTLFQTDKAKYQPGQKVLFRVITLSHDLKALNSNLSEVWIETPDRIRIAQWKNVETNTGMVQLDMQLTEEPPLGRWNIYAKTSQEKISKSFQVEEYVLPTFEVSVEAPSYIENNERTVTVKVCGKYTFGQPLVGANVSINATASISSYQYDRNPNLLRNISDFAESDEQGCAVFDLLVSKIGIGRVGRGNSVTLTAVVEEAGTGLKQVETKSVQQQYSSVSLTESDNSQRFLKPNLPYYGQYTLKQQDQTPSAGEIIKVCYTATYKDRALSSSDDPKETPKDVLYNAASKFSEQIETEFGYTPFFWETKAPKQGVTGEVCREYRTDETGSITYYIPPQSEEVDKIEIQVTARVGGDRDSHFSTLRAFFSPSQSYVGIDAHLLPSELPCSGDVTVQLLTSQEGAPPPMHYKILSRGRIIKVGNMNTTSLTFPVLAKMGPEFKLLVYYVKESGEVVSDSRTFKVAKCFPNQVQVSWDKETVKPGDTASFTIRAAPNSVCGISAVDRSTELLGTSNQITVDSVFDQLRQLVIGRYQRPQQIKDDFRYCRDLQLSLVDTLKNGGATQTDLTEQPEQADAAGSVSSSGNNRFIGLPPPREPTYRTDREDALKPFDEAGFLVMSNLGLESRPCYKRVEPVEIPEPLLSSVDKVQGGSGGGFAQESVAFSAAAPPRPQAFAFAQEDADVPGGSRFGGAEVSQEDQVRDFFPEAFAFSIETLDANGVKVLTQEMPDTITSWVGSAVCTNSQEGFGLANKSSINTFKPFFVKTSLPYSIKRGEVLKMSATVFNYLDSSLSVYLELGASEQYSLSDPAAPAGFDLCIAAGRSETKQFPLTFSDLGEVNVTVSAKVKDGNCQEPNAVAPGSDTIIRHLVIKPEGFPQEETTSSFVCLDKGDENHVDTIEMPQPEGLVPDSERAYFSVIGDLLGPTYQNLDSGLIEAPTGGGEPNMITMMPNIYIRDYLERVGQLTERERRQTDHNMKSGYQRELRYRRRDGSFSSYGPADREGSVFLTALVIDAFKKASKYIDIDETVISKAKDWVLRQQKPDGCFERKGDLIHKEMKGGTERGGEAALTAFVMLALKDSATSDELASGFACLEDALVKPELTLYSEILMAYTYLKMGVTTKGQRMVDKLLEKATQEGYDVLYWEGDRSSIIGGSRAVDVEMTARMVLSLLHISGKDYVEKAARAVRWINQQRNSKGGLVSTQDTIVAVQALTEFAVRTFASDLNTAVSVTAGGQPVEMSVDASNRLLMQQKKIPDLQLPATVTFDISPPGCVVTQTVLRYSSTLKVPDPAFSLGVATKPRGRTGYEMEACTSYIGGPGQVDRVIFELEMPSGYIPVDSTLRNLRQHKALRNYKSEEGKIVFTLQGITEDKTCLEFRIIQLDEVENLKPSVAKVYDFYRPEDRNIAEYELPVAA